jgi:urease accessory protein UreF
MSESIEGDPTVLYHAMHICDSAFPAGALAHSVGLESALSHGFVERGDITSLENFIYITSEQAIGLSVPFVSDAHKAVKRIQNKVQLDYLREIARLDAQFQSLMSNDVAQRASVLQGKGFLRVAQEAFPSEKLLMLEQFIRRSKSSGNMPTYGHYPVLFGFVCGNLGIPVNITRRMFLRCIVRDIISAASRLSIVGPLEGARVQAMFHPKMEEMLEAMEANLPTDGAATFRHQVSPVLEIIQGRQDSLYSRLFNS